MNQKAISEIKRRLNPDKKCPSLIRGCYIAADGHIISEFTEDVFTLAEEDNQKYMAVFKRALSGTPGQNLLEIQFSNEQVNQGEAYQVLAALRNSQLKDDDAVSALYHEVIEYVKTFAAAAQSVDEMNAMPNYAVLLLTDTYDVRFRGKNDEEDPDRADKVFSYVLCAICPVKETKPVMGYNVSEGNFRNQPPCFALGNPEAGFLFPALEDGSANIYSALYYTRDAADMHDALVENVFQTPVYMPATEQKESFRTILSESLGDECSLEVVQTVQDTVSSFLEEQKADKHAEPLQLSKESVGQILTAAGVSEEKVDAFKEHYTETFGADAALPAVNMVTPKQFTMNTPSVSIKVDPEHSDLVETRVIDGKSYIMILADGAVEVNGITLSI